MPEFALVAPVLFLIIFGIFDFGRGIVAYIAIQHAANEGARVAVQGEPGVGGSGAPFTPPCTFASSGCSVSPNAGVINAAISDTGAVKLVAAPCPHGPLPAVPSITTSVAGLPQSTGWVFVSEPEAITSPGWVSSLTYTNGTDRSNANNAPGGDSSSSDSGGCIGAGPATSTQLQVTVVYRFTPIIPAFLRIPASLTLVAWSVYETEY